MGKVFFLFLFFFYLFLSFLFFLTYYPHQGDKNKFEECFVFIYSHFCEDKTVLNALSAIFDGSYFYKRHNISYNNNNNNNNYLSIYFIILFLY